MPNPHHPFRFSRTGLRGLKASPTLTINDRIKEMMAAGREVFHMGFGESRFPVHPQLAQALRDNVSKRSYLPSLGILPLRQAIADFYAERLNLDVAAEQVIIGPGSKSLLYAVMLALDGDVILPTPAWVSYSSQAKLSSRPILEVPMDPDADYRLDVERLRTAVHEAASQWRHPDLLLVNTPHNPTGTLLSAEVTEELARFAREHALMILSDEIYSLVTHDSNQHVSPARAYPEGTVIFGGLSKHMSLGGWRFGMAILPPGPAGQALARAVQAIAGCTWSCVAAPVQYAALVAYSNSPEVNNYVQACARMHAIRTHYLYDALVEFGINCPRPSGAFYLYPSFARWREPLALRNVRTCQDLAIHLLENYEIALLPGASFGDDPHALALRLSTSYLDAETDEQAENLVSAFEDDPDPERFVQDRHPRLRGVVERLAEFLTDLEEDL
jgi:aspartate/methionine/tyrosine aminotransferase